jgi:hypothetical protein
MLGKISAKSGFEKWCSYQITEKTKPYTLEIGGDK